MINKRIMAALKEIGIPVYYLDRGEGMQECIIFNFIKNPHYSDNKTEGGTYNIILNIYSTGQNLLDLTDSVISSMCNNDFIEGTSPGAQYIEPLNLYNQALNFKIYI